VKQATQQIAAAVAGVEVKELTSTRTHMALQDPFGGATQLYVIFRQRERLASFE
jgi:hypothetical protein